MAVRQLELFSKSLWFLIFAFLCGCTYSTCTCTCMLCYMYVLFPLASLLSTWFTHSMNHYCHTKTIQICTYHSVRTANNPWVYVMTYEIFSSSLEKTGPDNEANWDKHWPAVQTISGEFTLCWNIYMFRIMVCVCVCVY